MVWTKGEVDKYVIQVERNCASAHEVSRCFLSFILAQISRSSVLNNLLFRWLVLQRNLKGFAFARLYKEASDNESAKRLVHQFRWHFLSKFSDSAIVDDGRIQY